MSYPLRLPPELDAEARERCKRLGVSLNALIAIALDQYLRGAAGASRVAPAKAPRRVAAKRVQPGELGAEHPDWRFFHNAEFWPWVDPDPLWEAERQRLTAGLDESAPAVLEQVERAYWATRERPAGA